MTTHYSYISLIVLFCTSLHIQQRNISNPTKEEVSHIDSLYVVYVNAPKKDRMQKGRQVVEELIKQQFIIDSLLQKNSLPEDEFERKLTKAIASYLLRSEQFRQSFSAAERLVFQSEAASDTAKLITGYYFMGISSQKMGNMDKGLMYAMKCYELCKAVNDTNMLSSTLNNLGNIYMTNKEDSVAIIYFKESLKIEQDLGRKEAQGIRWGNISSAYINLNKLPEALYAAKEGLKLSREAGREDRVAIRLYQLSAVYIAMKSYDEALKYATESYQYFKRSESTYGQAITLNALREIEQFRGNPIKAEKYLEQALLFAEQEHNQLLMQDIYKNLYKLNKTKDPAKALNYLERFISLKDSVFNTDNQKQLNDFRIKYETYEKEAQIALQKAEIAQTKLHRQLLSAITIFVLAICAMLYYMYRQRLKQNKKLKELNATKDKLFSIISHDLKSPAMAQKVAIGAMIRQANKYDKETMEMFSAFNNATESQLSLLQNLLDWACIQTGKMAYNPIAFNICDTVVKNMDLYSISAKNKQLQLISDLPENCIVKADRQMINTILCNLLNNAVKFSKPNDTVSITVSCMENYARISVIDNGTGISQQQIDDLMYNGKNTSKEGTVGEKGSGLGLIICKELLERNNSRLEIKSNNTGSVFSFNLSKA